MVRATSSILFILDLSSFVLTLLCYFIVYTLSYFMGPSVVHNVITLPLGSRSPGKLLEADAIGRWAEFDA